MNGSDGYDDMIAPVGHYPKGKSYYGAMDMAGNVWEWTSDWYSDVYYAYTANKNPKSPIRLTMKAFFPADAFSSWSNQ